MDTLELFDSAGVFQIPSADTLSLLPESTRQAFRAVELAHREYELACEQTKHAREQVKICRDRLRLAEERLRDVALAVSAIDCARAFIETAKMHGN